MLYHISFFFFFFEHFSQKLCSCTNPDAEFLKGTERQKALTSTTEKGMIGNFVKEIYAQE